MISGFPLILMISDEETKRSFKDAFSLGAGTLAVALCAALTIRLDAHLGAIRSEMSFTENTQLFFILLTAFNFVRLGIKERHLKHAIGLIVGFFVVVFIRECDGYLDLIRHGFWIVPALTVTGAALFYASFGIKTLVREFAEILSSPFLIVVIGVILLLTYSRIFGMADFWKELMAENYLREVKTAAEESTELLSYGLIWLGSALCRRHFEKRRSAGTREDAAGTR